MFKIGDRVVCVNTGETKWFTYGLKLYKIYTIKDMCADNLCHIKEKQHIRFSVDMFILLTDFRKLKLRRICSKK